jgi:antitoxin VapB
MQVTKVFKSGNSQAVRIPVEFQFDTDEVEIFRRDDVLTGRTDDAPQERLGL